MKKYLFGLTLVALSAGTAEAGSCDPKTVSGSRRKVTAAEAHVNPRPTDKITGNLSAGTEVDVISTRDVDGQTWYLVRWPEAGSKKAGWIVGNHLLCD